MSTPQTSEQSIAALHTKAIIGLLKRVRGYTLQEKKITYEYDSSGEKHLKSEVTTRKSVAPDLAAITFVLRSLDPQHWSDTPADTSDPQEEPLDLAQFTDAQLHHIVAGTYASPDEPPSLTNTSADGGRTPEPSSTSTRPTLQGCTAASQSSESSSAHIGLDTETAIDTLTDADRDTHCVPQLSGQASREPTSLPNEPSPFQQQQQTQTQQQPFKQPLQTQTRQPLHATPAVHTQSSVEEWASPILKADLTSVPDEPPTAPTAPSRVTPPQKSYYAIGRAAQDDASPTNTSPRSASLLNRAGRMHSIGFISQGAL